MFDTMTLTKAVGAFCGMFLIFLLGGWAADELYNVEGDGHGEEQAYTIDTGEEESAGDEAESSEPPVEELLASADIGAGERVFNKCKACHKLEEGANGVGPSLYQVVDGPVGATEGFTYSGALSAVADQWSPENLYGFLKDPQGWAPGTKMGFAGLSKPEDRADVIAYLETTNN